MKIYFALVSVLLLSFSPRTSSAQEGSVQGSTVPQQPSQPSTPLRDRFFFGGSLGLQFGSYTYIDVSPLVGFKITEKIHAGLGLTYIYYKVKDQYYGSYETSSYGGRVFGRYYILDNLFGHVEYEILNMEVPDGLNSSGQYDVLVRENITSLMVGGGYAQPIGSNAAITLMILFNLTEEQWSPYQNPIFRIGFSAGF